MKSHLTNQKKPLRRFQVKVLRHVNHLGALPSPHDPWILGRHGGKACDAFRINWAVPEQAMALALQVASWKMIRFFQ